MFRKAPSTQNSFIQRSEQQGYFSKTVTTCKAPKDEVSDNYHYLPRTYVQVAEAALIYAANGRYLTFRIRKRTMAVFSLNRQSRQFVYGIDSNSLLRYGGQRYIYL